MRALIAAGLLLTLVPGAEGATQKTVQEGIAVELSVSPVDPREGELREGKRARVSLRFTDPAGTPLGSLYPAAWMDRVVAREEDPEACRKKTQGFLGGGLLSRPELDLNTYYVLALNDDASISVVDPLFGYGNSKLLAMVFLKSPGEDWALTPDGARLFVSMPGSDRIAVVETSDWTVVTEIKTPRQPRRLKLQPDGALLWVAREGGVTAVSTRALRSVAEIATGPGTGDLAVSQDSRFLFVANDTAGTVSVVDTGKLEKMADVKVGAGPLSLDWSEPAGAAWVASADGTVAAVRPGSPEPVARVRTGPGLGRLRFAPGGRLAFIPNPEKNEVHILDAARGRIVQTADVEAGPDQVTFSDELAYVRHRGSETVLMIPLKEVGVEGRPVPLVDFPGGQHPPGRLAMPTLADGIVQAPGAAAVLVANSEDKAIYYYKEGMAAPMGHFPAYGKRPRAVQVVDRSLRETAPGVYETNVQLGRAGTYDVAVLVGSPKVLHCFPLTVAEDPKAGRRKALGIEYLVDRREVGVGEEVAVRLRITDPDGGAPRSGLKDVRVLTFLSPGQRQQRQVADEVGNGVYEVRFRPTREGVWFVFLEVDSAGLSFEESPSLTLQVNERG
ncbi:MAG TPA: cytochrome D1 [Thermoanaerobaculia bacterium]|nr:cytochrome D1 [Thermoanaerobaculia bacterium]